jgi:hypothetical protein
MSKNGDRRRGSVLNDPSAPASSADNTLVVPCTTTEVEKTKYRCEILMNRCFGHLDYREQQLANVLIDDICAPLHCQNGILMGISINSGEESMISYTILKWALCILIVGVAATYGK